MQKISLESIGDKEKLAAVDARQEARRSDRQRALRTHLPLSEALLVANPAVFYDYLAEFRTHGEISARNYLHEEAERWLRLHGETDCVS